jgi:hypothetical protein
MANTTEALNYLWTPHRAKVHIVNVYRLAEPTGTWVSVGTGAFVYLQVSKRVIYKNNSTQSAIDQLIVTMIMS